MYIIMYGGIRYCLDILSLHSRGTRYVFRMPALGDIKSRCKITAFFAHACAYIQKKCVKIDTFDKKSRARTLFICVYEIFFVPLCGFLRKPVKLRVTNNEE